MLTGLDAMIFQEKDSEWKCICQKEVLVWPGVSLLRFFKGRGRLLTCGKPNEDFSVLQSEIYDSVSN